MLNFRTRSMERPVEAPERAALRLAINTAEVAARAAANAEEVAARAFADLQRARAVLDGFAGLRARVIEHRTAQLEAGEPGGQALPADILADRAAATAAADDLEDAATTHAKLVGKAEVLAAAAVEARAAVQACVAGVMGADAASMAQRVRQLEAEAGRLRASLMDFANGWSLADRAAFSPVPFDVASLFGEAAHAPLVNALGADLSQIAAPWADYRKCLAVDPTATVEASRPAQDRARA